MSTRLLQPRSPLEEQRGDQRVPVPAVGVASDISEPELRRSDGDFSAGS
jgi:hypothetical protein